MKILINLLVLAVSFAGCKRHLAQGRRDYKYNYIADHKWAGLHRGNHYDLSLTKGDDIWFDGVLVVNARDTFRLHGFVKGHTYPSTYRSPKNPPGEHGTLMMEYLGDSVLCRDYARQMADTVFFVYKRMK